MTSSNSSLSVIRATLSAARCAHKMRARLSRTRRIHGQTAVKMTKGSSAEALGPLHLPALRCAGQDLNLRPLGHEPERDGAPGDLAATYRTVQTRAVNAARK